MVTMVHRTLFLILTLFTFSMMGLFSEALHAQNWTEVATDERGDGANPSLNDGKSLSWHYNRSTDTLWFQVEVYGQIATDAFGVNIVLDTDGNQNNGSAWWGSNAGFRYDKLITVWVTRSGQRYVGTIGVADPAGAGSGNYTNLYQNNIQIIVDPSQNTYVLGVKRSEVDNDGNMRVIAAVGSNQFWNDDVPNSGAGIIEDKGPEPAALISANAITFDPVLLGESTEQSIKISAANEAGLEVTSISFDVPDEALSIETSQPLPTTLSSGEDLDVTVIYAPTEPSTSLNSSLLISTNDALTPNHSVSISGEIVVQSSRLSAAEIDFGEVGVGRTAEASVTVYPQNRAGLKIGRISIDTMGSGVKGFSYSIGSAEPITLNESDSLVIDVSFRPIDSGSINQTLIIELLDSDGTLQEGDRVVLSGKGLYPIATVSNDNVDFGEVLVGEESSEIYVSISPGNAAGLEISSVDFQSSDAEALGFHYDIPGETLPLTLSQDDRLNIVITFTPAQEGDVVAILRASTNNQSLPDIDIQLSGKGVLDISSAPESRNAIRSLSISPNPLSGQARCALYLETSGRLDLSAINTAGISTELFNETVEAGDLIQMIDCSKLAPGAYVLHVTLDDELAGQEKFVVQ